MFQLLDATDPSCHPGRRFPISPSPETENCSHTSCDEGKSDSIWTRETSGSKERLVATADDGEVSGTMLSPDDAYLYYRQMGNDGVGNLLRVPVKGGAS